LFFAVDLIISATALGVFVYRESQRWQQLTLPMAEALQEDENWATSWMVTPDPIQ
jgi:hypothetical protein